MKRTLTTVATWLIYALVFAWIPLSIVETFTDDRRVFALELLSAIFFAGYMAHALMPARRSPTEDRRRALECLYALCRYTDDTAMCLGPSPYREFRHEVEDLLEEAFADRIRIAVCSYCGYPETSGHWCECRRAEGKS